MLIGIAIGVLALLALVVLGAPYLERQLMYFPYPLRSSPASAGLADVAERTLETPDGQRLIAWYGKARPGRPTLLYFHGNGGGLAARADRIRFFLDRGIGVFILAYRGYSGSTGIPSERANVADALLAYDTLAKEGVKARDIVLYGESLGSGIAVQVAAARPVGGVILDAPYTSIVDVAERFYPYLPGRWLMTDRYETMHYIGDINAPLLIVHGEADGVIPIEMGRAVFAAAKEPKELATFPMAGHSDHPQFGSYDAILKWLEKIRPAAEESRGASAAR